MDFPATSANTVTANVIYVTLNVYRRTSRYRAAKMKATMDVKAMPEARGLFHDNRLVKKE